MTWAQTHIPTHYFLSLNRLNSRQGCRYHVYWILFTFPSQPPFKHNGLCHMCDVAQVNLSLVCRRWTWAHIHIATQLVDFIVDRGLDMMFPEFCLHFRRHRARYILTCVIGVHKINPLLTTWAQIYIPAHYFLTLYKLCGWQKAADDCCDANVIKIELNCPRTFLTCESHLWLVRVKLFNHDLVIE